MGANSIKINKKEFHFIRELGKGGFGRVIQVSSKSDKNEYAIKVIPIKGEAKEIIQKFQNEADILSKFNCNNIVKYYDSSKDKNNFYILMEFCEGENLRNFIEKNINNNTLIDEKILIKIIKQLCIGIKEIHDKKIVHRDLTPENIFMNKNMEVKIGDFGISKNLDLFKTHTPTTKKAGTDNYIAPEILYKGIYNEKSDMWSLGCIIYELFNLSIYSKDKSFDELKKIDSNIYNCKWQELIYFLLQPDYTKRLDINQFIKLLKDELNINLYNKIIGEIYINKNDINKDVQIINSFENFTKDLERDDDDEDVYKYENEKEIKENTEIKINEKRIEFAYYYKFNKEGKYIIEYSFKDNLTKTCCLFARCNSLIGLDL